MITVNGKVREVDDGQTVGDLVGAVLAERGAPDGGRGVAVAVDGSVVPRTERAATALVAGARVEIVTAVQGG